jgi:hypothetical protein
MARRSSRLFGALAERFARIFAASVAAAVVLCAACGSGGSGSATVNGTINGQSMSAQDAVSNISMSGSTSQGLLLITNASKTCSKLSANQQWKNIKAIAIGIVQQAGSGGFSAPAAPGIYLVMKANEVSGVSGNLALATYLATDAHCNQTILIGSSGGTVTLTRVDPGGYSGTFDITFSDASHVTGSFVATNCAALTPSLAGGTCT